MTIPDYVSRADVDAAQLTIQAVERELGRKLGACERRSLIADNFTSWTTSYVRDVVEAIVEP
jgi:hypothetical protein